MPHPRSAYSLHTNGLLGLTAVHAVDEHGQPALHIFISPTGQAALPAVGISTIEDPELRADAKQELRWLMQAHDHLSALTAARPGPASADPAAGPIAQPTSCEAHTTQRHQDATVVLTLRTQPPTADLLAALHSRWPGAALAHADGLVPVRDGDTLNITLPARALVDFLSWCREQPAPEHSPC
ncbi:hypothetical protein [Nocardia noduli]|uniref:hypothetical protein n=1 Tax=Nocardia noduli TaxID=2815722 RepID=UPI001C21FD9E|nr:hypothetical protein [Nocardia noduli]